MAIDFPTSPTAGQVYSYNGVTYVYTAQGVWTTAGASAVGIIGGSPQGRLTLQTATPVMTTTQAAKTTIFYTPYVGDRVPIYDGTNMVMTTFSELSVATTDTTKSPAAIGASKVNDWFAWSDAGTVRIGHGPDWTSDTARSAGTALVMTNGIWLNNAAITNGPAASRGTYVGTTRSNASSQLDWKYGTIAAPPGESWFGVWNTYNRVEMLGVCGETTTNWTYSSITPRAANGQNTYRASFVAGLSEDNCRAAYNTAAAVSVTAGGTVGLGFDSIVSYHSNCSAAQQGGAAAFPTSSEFMIVPPIGWHFVQALEAISAGSGTAAFYGAFSAAGANIVSSKLFFSFRM